MIICVDFDGTCVTHDYPRIGIDIGSVPVLIQLVQAGHKLVIFTMRSDKNDTLADAINWFNANNIPLYGINTNPTQKNWTSSPKALADLYIDDAALGIPLKYNVALSARPYVDWTQVEILLKQYNII